MIRNNPRVDQTQAHTEAEKTHLKGENDYSLLPFSRIYCSPPTRCRQIQIKRINDSIHNSWWTESSWYLEIRNQRSFYLKRKKKSHPFFSSVTLSTCLRGSSYFVFNKTYRCDSSFFSWENWPLVSFFFFSYLTFNKTQIPKSGNPFSLSLLWDLLFIIFTSLGKMYTNRFSKRYKELYTWAGI